MQGARDILSSERGVLVAFLLITSIVFVVMRVITVDQWLTLLQWVVVPYLLAKTATGAIDRIAGKDVTDAAR